MPVQRYDGVAIALHWLLAVGIVGTFSIGLYMAGLPLSPLRVQLINWHKWAGLTILALSALRLLWRLTHPPPPMPPSIMACMPPWQRKVQRWTLMALYVLFFVVPLLGWAYSSAANVQVVWFGVLPLPDLLPANKALADDLLKPLHRAGAFALATAVLLHLSATLWHQFVMRDGLMRRMWPATARKGQS